MTALNKSLARGDIWLMNLSPATGKEKKGVHPVLIIQNNVGNVYSDLTIIAAITGNLRKFPVTVLVKNSFQNGLSKESAVQCDQIYTIDKSRLQKQLGVLESEYLEEVDSALQVSLQI